MTRLLAAAATASLLVAVASLDAQVSFDRLLQADREPHNWLTYSRTYCRRGAEGRPEGGTRGETSAQGLRTDVPSTSPRANPAYRPSDRPMIDDCNMDSRNLRNR